MYIKKNKIYIDIKINLYNNVYVFNYKKAMKCINKILINVYKNVIISNIKYENVNVHNNVNNVKMIINWPCMQAVVLE